MRNLVWELLLAVVLVVAVNELVFAFVRRYTGKFFVGSFLVAAILAGEFLLVWA